MFSRRTPGTTPMVEALRLAQVLDWRVTRGAYRCAGGCSCLDPACLQPGRHPADADWPQRATRARATIESWWSKHPDAGVVLLPGEQFDVLDVPQQAGSELLGSLVKQPERCPPVAATADGRVRFFVQPGAAASLALLGPRYLGRRHPELLRQLRVHGRGDFVFAPPSGLGGPDAVSWLISPFGPHSGIRPIPLVAHLLPHLAHVGDHVETRSA